MDRYSMSFINAHHDNRYDSRSKGRCIFFAAIILAFLLGLFFLTRALFSSPAMDPNSYDPVTLEPIKPKGVIGKIKHFVFNTEPTLEGAKEDRINILLLGQGGLGHDGPYLSDTIIIASIKPSTGQVSFVNVPRDLYVDIPGHNSNKINHANAYGESNKKGSGPELAEKVIERTFALDIHYYVRVDFRAFEALIDDVGGITVDVERSFIDSEYPAPNHEYQTISFTKGAQTMDGDTALKYVRSRHGNNGEGSDFARSKRQQKVILALKEKMLSFQTIANPVKLTSIVDSLEQHVLTNVDFSDIISMLKLAKNLDTNNIINLRLDSGPDGYLVNDFTPGGAYILKPESGTFDDINFAIENIFNEPPEISENNTPEQVEPVITYTGANVEVQNGTWRAGMAGRIKETLIESKFAVTSIGNTNVRPIKQSGIYLVNENNTSDRIADALSDELEISILETIPVGETFTTGTDILVILGDDFKEEVQVELPSETDE